MIPAEEITIRIPGSTGNVGPGFDCIGLAVNIFNKISIKKSDKKFEMPQSMAKTASFFIDQAYADFTKDKNVKRKA